MVKKIMKMMKKLGAIILVIMILFGSCRAKRSYNTYEGKRKLKHYNSIQHQ